MNPNLFVGSPPAGSRAEGIRLRRELFVEEFEGFVAERLPAAVLVVLEQIVTRKSSISQLAQYW